jgi:hypothetical protein
VSERVDNLLQFGGKLFDRRDNLKQFGNGWENRLSGLSLICKSILCDGLINDGVLTLWVSMLFRVTSCEFGFYCVLSGRKSVSRPLSRFSRVSRFDQKWNRESPSAEATAGLDSRKNAKGSIEEDLKHSKAEP